METAAMLQWSQSIQDCQQQETRITMQGVLEGPKAYLILSLQSLPGKLLYVYETSCSFSPLVGPYPCIPKKLKYMGKKTSYTSTF